MFLFSRTYTMHIQLNNVYWKKRAAGKLIKMIYSEKFFIYLESGETFRVRPIKWCYLFGILSIYQLCKSFKRPLGVVMSISSGLLVEGIMNMLFIRNKIKWGLICLLRPLYCSIEKLVLTALSEHKTFEAIQMGRFHYLLCTGDV